MNQSSRSAGRTLRAAVIAFLALTVALGLAYPLAMTAVGAVVPTAHGKVVRIDGKEVGSELLAQAPAGPEWFDPRPSAVDHDAAESGGSNEGPSNPELAKEVADRRAALLQRNPQARGEVPADALTASSSGLDPDISPAYARWQAPRVAAARHLAVADVLRLVDEHTQRRTLGIVGEPRVNTVLLNAALAQHR